MPANSSTARTEREIATIKADVAAMGHLFQKLDDAIDIADLADSVGKSTKLKANKVYNWMTGTIK